MLLTANELLDKIHKNEQTEGYGVDWTAGIENPDSIGEKIAAFATSEGGWLIIVLVKYHFD